MDSLDKVLLNDVLKAYEQMGRVDAFVKDEKLLEAVLLKLFAQQAPQPEIIINLTAEMPWLDFENRLSYKQGALSASLDTPRLLPFEAKSPPTEDTNVPWKDEPPDGLAKTMRLYDKD
jgi:hypothetical protein